MRCNLVESLQEALSKEQGLVEAGAAAQVALQGAKLCRNTWTPQPRLVCGFVPTQDLLQEEPSLRH